MATFVTHNSDALALLPKGAVQVNTRQGIKPGTWVVCFESRRDTSRWVSVERARKWACVAMYNHGVEWGNATWYATPERASSAADARNERRAHGV